MPDLRNDPAFAAAVQSARETFRLMATKFKVADAIALHARSKGSNNLQGHAHSIVPLAVLVARSYPGLLVPVRRRTDLKKGMTRTIEGGDNLLWDPIAAATAALVDEHNADVIVQALGTQAPQTAGRVARTYLSTAFGGGQTNGGGGNTVLKRMLKLLAHVQIGISKAGLRWSLLQ